MGRVGSDTRQTAGSEVQVSVLSCAWCDAPFTRRASRHKYCSPACRIAAKRVRAKAWPSASPERNRAAQRRYVERHRDEVNARARLRRRADTPLQRARKERSNARRRANYVPRVLEPIECPHCGRQFRPIRRGQRFDSGRCCSLFHGKSPVYLRRNRDNTRRRALERLKREQEAA